jgi:hypothetical protein
MGGLFDVPIRIKEYKKFDHLLKFLRGIRKKSRLKNIFSTKKKTCKCEVLYEKASSK